MAFSQSAAEDDPTVARQWRRWPTGLLNRNRVIDAGLAAWALIGLLGVAWVASWFVGQLSLVFIPLVIALFPAALLAPAADWLKRHGARPALAAAVVLLGFLIAFTGVLVTIGWLVADELAGVVDAVEEGYADIQDWVDDQFGIEIPAIGELLQQIQDWALGDDGPAGEGAITGAATTTLEVVASFLLGLVALFFYLKDGRRITLWFIRLFPPRLRDDADQVSGRVWFTLGAYFRGQLIVAAVDAFFIGLGLVILDVPLAIPLAILVFIGGLFPVVGAFTAGALAVLIALADQGLVVALIVLGINVAVQQAEGNLLEPLIVGRATHLHPLAVLVALTAGGLTFGILGAFLAVPVVASLKAGIGYLVKKDMARPPEEMPEGSDTEDPRDRPVAAGEGPDPARLTGDERADVDLAANEHLEDHSATGERSEDEEESPVEGRRR
jgi:putative heme transporter